MSGGCIQALTYCPSPLRSVCFRALKSAAVRLAVLAKRLSVFRRAVRISGLTAAPLLCGLLFISQFKPVLFYYALSALYTAFPALQFKSVLFVYIFKQALYCYCLPARACALVYLCNTVSPYTTVWRPRYSSPFSLCPLRCR